MPGPKPRPIEYVIDENGCYVCTSHPGGKLKIKGKSEEVHKVVYRECFGELDEGKLIYRVCGNKHCINPEHMKAMAPSEFEQRSIKYVVDENGCHICTSHPSGFIRVNGKQVYVHRVVYREHFGEPDKDKRIYRICGNERCINIEHMKVMSRSEYEDRPIEYVVDENGCHICTSHPYNNKMFNGKRLTLQQYVYRTKTGEEIPKGKVVAHKCGNKKCVNPDHLYLTTRKEATAAYMTRLLEYEIDPITGCHNCTSHPLNRSGYPRITVDGKAYVAHRYVYEKEYGKIPEGYVVRHRCDNRRCINIEHLELGTHEDNMRDMVERDRQAKGSKHGNAKLTEEDVREIRRRLDAGDSSRQLARIYGVSKSVILDIKHRRIWRHVD